MEKGNLYQSDIVEFVVHSDYIENERSEEAHTDHLSAFDYIFALPKLTISDVLKTHAILMRRRNPRIAGKFRDCDVFIGGKRKYFISDQLFRDEVSSLLKKINSVDVSGNKEEYAKHLHVVFEEIHPFEDGNGRVGRLLYNWHRVNLGLPLHIIREGEEQMEYYKWFK